MLNRPSSVNDSAINRLPQKECNILLDEFPTVTETRKAIQDLSSVKAPGTDAIPAKVSLLSNAGKILAKILLNRLNAHLDHDGLIPESQRGFRKDKGTIDMIFTDRQLQEKCQEQNIDRT